MKVSQEAKQQHLIEIKKTFDELLTALDVKAKRKPMIMLYRLLGIKNPYHAIQRYKNNNVINKKVVNKLEKVKELLN